jgi:hypothetical protein
MNEQVFIQTVNVKAKELGISPLLLLSGIEGLYTFKDIHINQINYQFLDNLILTIFALRIGDSYHTIAEGNLDNPNHKVRTAATRELTAMSEQAIAESANPYLQSFASIIDGKSVIYHYHEKALEVAAFEVQKAHNSFGDDSIGSIMLQICKKDLNESLNLGAWFNN